MTSMSFPVPADFQVQQVVDKLAADGVDSQILDSIKSVFEHGVRKGVENAFLYKYITKESVIDEMKMLYNQDDISLDVLSHIYSMTEEDILAVLSNDEYDWERFQLALETQSTVDLSDIYDEAIEYAVDILMRHMNA